MLKTIGVDDWIMVVAAVLNTACFSLFVALTRNGVGRHSEYFTYVRPDLFTVFFELAWWYAWIIVVAYSSIKISIAFFLLRLADHRRHWRWALHSIIVFNLVSDLVLAILPVPMVWKLQTNVRTRISLCIILGLGSFACGTAVYKIPLQYHFFEEADFSGKGAWYYIWQQIEMNIGIIAACLPTLKPLAANFFGVVSALTFEYGSRYGSNAPSRPHISNGYMKHSERSDTQSYVMGEMKNTRTKAMDPFEGQSPAQSTARGGSSAAQSDESILHHDKGIMRTTEVRIS
ncbi:hypothetical protein E8E11_002324 [Didymella keratinophila]|nr:hypothetical protein E8E11_002324 [Didymella keratinophila]